MTTSLDAMVVREKEVNGQKKSFWTKIGKAWQGRDGIGWLIRLDATPLDGVIHLRPPLPPRGDAVSRGTGREPGDDTDDIAF